MKFLLLGLAVVTSVFATDMRARDFTTITKSQKFVSFISPDKLSTNLSITMIEQDYTQASNELNVLSTALKKYENICKSSGYSVMKAMEWDNTHKKNIFIGYRGVVNIDCQYTTLSEMEKVYNIPALKKLITNNKNVTISNQGTRWIVSDDALAKKKEELETQAVLYANIFKMKLSALLKKECSIKEIHLSALNQHPMPMYDNRVLLKEAVASSYIQANEPTKEDATLNYSASYIFACEN
ncbi:hypothetical protein KKG72_08830 [bacterium]|nr:hypothetical protein [bacterium]MBU1995129.1 hypothetical protein [bacterium]